MLHIMMMMAMSVLESEQQVSCQASPLLRKLLMTIVHSFFGHYAVEYIPLILQSAVSAFPSTCSFIYNIYFGLISVIVNVVIDWVVARRIPSPLL